MGVNATDGYRLVSYFDTLTEAGFAPFRARGLRDPSDLVISRAERDAAPLRCSGQTFVGPAPASETGLLNLSVEQPIRAAVQLLGPLEAQSILLLATAPEPVQGMVGSVFVGAELPASRGGGVVLLDASGGWAPFTGCSGAPAAYQGRLFAPLGIPVVRAAADLRPYRATVLHVGYGLGATVEQACTRMLQDGSYTSVHKVE